MIDCMNLAGVFIITITIDSNTYNNNKKNTNIGIDFCCFGNHEADIPLPQLLHRIRESKFKW